MEYDNHCFGKKRLLLTKKLIYQELNDNPLFSVLSPKELSHLAENAKVLNYSLGEVVVKEGDEGDSMFILYSGKARVLSKDIQGQDITLATLSKGDHFGENSLITKERRNATVRASGDVVIIKIDKEDFNHLVAENPPLRDYFSKFLSNMAMHTFLKKTTLLGTLPAKEIREFLDKFKIKEFQEGEEIVKQGEEGDSFYIIRNGRVKVVIRDDTGREKTVNFLREGQFFGEIALVKEAPRTASVIAIEKTTLFLLEKQDFEELIQRSPQIEKVIQDSIIKYRIDIPDVQGINEEILKKVKKTKEKKELPVGKAPDTIRDSSFIKEETQDQLRKQSYQERKSKIKEKKFTIKHKRKIPFIRQRNEMDCGPTCLAMICGYYGKRIRMNIIRDLTHVSREGASMLNLAEAAENLGFATRGIKTSVEKLKELPLPAIVHWKGYHFVVLHKVQKDIMVVADPAIGIIRYSQKEFEENWSGRILLLEPTPKLTELKEESANPFSRFLPLLSPFRGIISQLILASLFLNLLGLAMPVITSRVVDKAIPDNDINFLNMLILALIIIIGTRLLMESVRQYLLAYTTTRLDYNMMRILYRHVLHLPMRFYQAFKSGDIIRRFHDTSKIRDMLAEITVTTFLDTMMVGFYFILMFYYNATLASFIAVLLPFYVIMGIIITPYFRRRYTDFYHAAGENDAYMVESINGIASLKSLSAEQSANWHWNNRYIKQIKSMLSLTKAGIIWTTISRLIYYIGFTLVLWYGAKEVLNKDLTLGQLMAFNVLLGIVFTPIMNLVAFWNRIQEARIATQRVNDILDSPIEGEETKKSVRHLDLVNGYIEFQNVTFRYGGKHSKNVLQNINLEILPGQTVGLVGRSGCGKSTFINLILRLFEPNEGRIFIDGYDINTVSLSSLRNQIGVVSQESFLFNGSVRDNISYGNPEASFEEIVSAAQLADAHDFVLDLPLGYDTIIGERGSTLSGGQRQRIAIARALIKNPGILIFDEATSSLDTESEKAIQDNMKTILTGRTSIIIAHRLSTIQNADVIIVLDSGIIVEMGDHKSLMENRGLYYYLSNQQLNL